MLLPREIALMSARREDVAHLLIVSNPWNTWLVYCKKIIQKSLLQQIKIRVFLKNRISHQLRYWYPTKNCLVSRVIDVNQTAKTRTPICQWSLRVESGLVRWDTHRFFCSKIWRKFLMFLRCSGDGLGIFWETQIK